MVDRRDDTPEIEEMVHTSLLQCAEWCEEGLHRRVLSEVEAILPEVLHLPGIEAQLLVWKAHALLAMGCPDRAMPAAARSWELEASPHACHLMANALDAIGNADEAEELLRMGWGLFPDSASLPVQLAMMLTDQGRLPEALDALREISSSAPLSEDMQVFLFGLRANLLATVGRWNEARTLLDEGLDRFPQSPLLGEAHESLNRGWIRHRAEVELVESWRSSLEELGGIAAEVDDAIVRCGAVTERPKLVELAARRLWRAFAAVESARLQAPEPWGAGFLLAVMELDGERPSASAMARSVGVSASTVRGALRRVRSFLDRLDPHFAHRSFGACSNPRLLEGVTPGKVSSGQGTLVVFPGAQADLVENE